MWHDLTEPDDFKNDWYGEATNQMGHTLLGIILAAVLCVAWFFVSGEMPYRSYVLVIVIAGYTGFELLVQGWKSGDSWFDSAMLSFGAGGLILPLREIEVDGPIVTLQFQPLLFSVICAVWALMLSARVYKRYDATSRHI